MWLKLFKKGYMLISKPKPAILSFEELVRKCSLVGLVDDSVTDLWNMMIPLPAGNKKILFPEMFFKWTEQARLYN